MNADQRKNLERLRARVKGSKRQLDWLHAHRRCDWQAIRAAEIEAGLALGRLAAAEGKLDEHIRETPTECEPARLWQRLAQGSSTCIGR